MLRQAAARAVAPPPPSAAWWAAASPAAERRAKYLLLPLDREATLVIHLGMTGNLLFRGDRQPHDHVAFELDRGPPLVFADPRRFGMLLALGPRQLERCRYLDELGLEPLEGELDGDFLYGHCRGRTRPVKSLLLDSRVVAGVGNIYASEALFRAGIRPSTRCHRLSRRRCALLAEKIVEVLSEAVAQGGTTISDYLGSGAGRQVPAAARRVRPRRRQLPGLRAAGPQRHPFRAQQLLLPFLPEMKKPPAPERTGGENPIPEAVTCRWGPAARSRKRSRRRGRTRLPLRPT